MGLIIPFENFAWLGQPRLIVHGLNLASVLPSTCFLAMLYFEMEFVR